MTNIGPDQKKNVFLKWSLGAGHRFRVRSNELPEGRKIPTPCVVCGKATREGKPYCTTHVLLSPYVREVLQRVEERQSELGRRPRRDGMCASDMLGALALGGRRSVLKMARSLDMPGSFAIKLARLLARLGEVKLSKTLRGALMVELTDQPDSLT